MTETTRAQQSTEAVQPRTPAEAQAVLSSLRAQDAADRDKLRMERHHTRRLPDVVRTGVLARIERRAAELQIRELCHNDTERQLIASGLAESNPDLPSEQDDLRQFAKDLPTLATLSPVAAQMLVDGRAPVSAELAEASRIVRARVDAAPAGSGELGFPRGFGAEKPAPVASSITRRFPELASTGGESFTAPSAGVEL